MLPVDFHCNLCGDRFDSLGELAEHTAEAHPVDDLPKKDDEKDMDEAAFGRLDDKI